MRSLGLAVLLLVVGCGNLAEPTEKVGRLAATLDDSGQVEVLIAPCREGVVVVTIAEGRAPDMPEDEENEQVGAWTALAGQAPSSLRPSEPGAKWSGDAAAGPTGDTVWIIDGTLEGEDNTALHGPAVSAADLTALGPDEVLVQGESNLVMPRAEFDGDCG